MQHGSFAGRSAVYACTLFLSALLLFFMEPLVAKRLLPLWGGTPAVWITCMVFFQAMLLAGYLYAHLIRTHLSARAQIALHLGLLGLSLLSLPLCFYQSWSVVNGVPPFVGLIWRLLLGIGLPFFVLSANAPLLQHWFTLSHEKQDPYPLYRASNLGSLIALLSFPTLMEPTIGIRAQGLIWGAGLLALGAMIAWCARRVSVKTPLGESATEAAERSPAPGAWNKFRWALFGLVPSSLMLGVTSHFTIDIAAIPLFWVLPLALYLFSFILAFSRLPAPLSRVTRESMPFAVMGLLLVAALGIGLSVSSALLLHLGVFFLVALALHAELAAIRPAPAHLTSFYLWMSLGGMLGGLFNSLLAPLLFVTPMEYPLALALAAGALCLSASSRFPLQSKRVILVELGLAGVAGGLILWLDSVWPSQLSSAHSLVSALETKMGLSHWNVATIIEILMCAALAVFQRRLALGLAVLVFVFSTWTPSSENGEEVTLARERNFFGAMELKASPLYVRVQRDDGSFARLRTNNGIVLTLVNGTTVHGLEYLAPGSDTTALTYYHPEGPVGDIFATHQAANGTDDVGVIGLGAGTIAAYGQPDRRITFFEIDDKVVRAAHKNFNYLEKSKSPTRIVLGDARLKLAEEPDRGFSMLFADAFSSDAIPVHLLTKEAVALYSRKVTPDGLMALHLTNRHLQLVPIVAKLAADLGLYSVIKEDDGDTDTDRYASSWAVLSRNPMTVATLLSRPGWKTLTSNGSTPLWTDDFTSYYQVLNLRSVPTR